MTRIYAGKALPFTNDNKVKMLGKVLDQELPRGRIERELMVGRALAS